MILPWSPMGPCVSAWQSTWQTRLERRDLQYIFPRFRGWMWTYVDPCQISTAPWCTRQKRPNSWAPKRPVQLLYMAWLGMTPDRCSCTDKRRVFSRMLFIRICPTVIYVCCVAFFINLLTSSTAQGGGGSFKNRNPIGEIGCCESQMKEREIDR